MLRQPCSILTWVGQAVFLNPAPEATRMDAGAYRECPTRAHLHPSNSDLHLLRNHYQHHLQAYQHALRLLKPDTEGHKASYPLDSPLPHSKDFLRKGRPSFPDLALPQGSVHLQVKAHLLGCHLVSSSKASHEQDDNLEGFLWMDKIPHTKTSHPHSKFTLNHCTKG